MRKVLGEERSMWKSLVGNVNSKDPKRAYERRYHKESFQTLLNWLRLVSSSCPSVYKV
jgi:hypothetical protein